MCHSIIKNFLKHHKKLKRQYLQTSIYEIHISFIQFTMSEKLDFTRVLQDSEQLISDVWYFTHV